MTADNSLISFFSLAKFTGPQCPQRSARMIPDSPSRCKTVPCGERSADIDVDDTRRPMAQHPANKVAAKPTYAHGAAG